METFSFPANVRKCLEANVDQKILFVQDNPKTKGAGDRYEVYKHATTVGEYLALNPASDPMTDWRFDVKHKYVVPVNNSSPPVPSSKAEAEGQADGSIASATDDKPSLPTGSVEPSMPKANEPSHKEPESQASSLPPASSSVHDSVPPDSVPDELDLGNSSKKPRLSTLPEPTAIATLESNETVAAASGDPAGPPAAVDEDMPLISLRQVPPPPVPPSALNRGRRRRGQRSRSRSHGRGDEQGESSSSSSSSGSSSVSQEAPEGGWKPLVVDGGQLVRDVVGDYVAGQGDPEANDKSVRKNAAGLSKDLPIMATNRSKFVWVVRGRTGLYTHDVETAAALKRSLLRGRRCDICGHKCAKDRVFRLRCYPRRQQEDPPEWERPRTMRPEVFQSGLRCMRGVLGIPAQSSKKVTEFRGRLQGALRSEDFDSQAWFKPLQHMLDAESTTFRTILEGEITRIIKACTRPLRALDNREAIQNNVSSASADGLIAKDDKRDQAEHVQRDLRIESGSSCVISEMRECIDEEPLGEDDAGKEVAPHELYNSSLKPERPPYILVIPSYGRPERLQNATLSFLRRQGIPQKNIQVWLAPGKAPGQDTTELERYRKALAEDWSEVSLHVGVKGIMEQRWHISLQIPEDTHIVSLDDDIEDVFVKSREGTTQDTLDYIPDGALEALIHHASDLMNKENAYIWGLSPSSNPMNMTTDRISRKNGMLNAYFYGYRNRHDEALRSIFSSSAEDVERSVRYFNQDGILLRYLMYGAKTIFKAPDGLALLYSDVSERKAAEDAAIEKICAKFPNLLSTRTGDDRRKSDKAMNFKFKSIGLGPLDTSGLSKIEAMRKDIEQHDPDEPVVPFPVPWRRPSSIAKALPNAPATDEKKASVDNAGDEQVLLSRCAQLKEMLASILAEQSVHSASRSAKRTRRSGKPSPSDASDGSKPALPSGSDRDAPEVLNDIIHMATSGKKNLTQMGFTPIPASPLPTIWPSAIVQPQLHTSQTLTGEAEKAAQPQLTSEEIPQSAGASSGAPEEKILQRWLAQGQDVLPLQLISPDEVAITNSITKACADRDRRQWLCELGSGLQDVPDERLRSFPDAAWMLEVKRAYANGKLEPIAESQRPPGVVLQNKEPKEQTCAPARRPSLTLGEVTESTTIKVPLAKHDSVTGSRSIEQAVPTHAPAPPTRAQNINDVLAYEFKGFHRPLLNRRFKVDLVTRINNRRSWWDQSREVFMYWQTEPNRWAISSRWDKGKDLLLDVRNGSEVGWAFSLSENRWQEFWQGEWKEVQVSQIQIPKDTPSQSTRSLMGETPEVLLRKGPEQSSSSSKRSMHTAIPVPLKGAPTITPAPTVPFLPMGQYSAHASSTSKQSVSASPAHQIPPTASLSARQAASFALSHQKPPSQTSSASSLRQARLPAKVEDVEIIDPSAAMPVTPACAPSSLSSSTKPIVTSTASMTDAPVAPEQQSCAQVQYPAYKKKIHSRAQDGQAPVCKEETVADEGFTTSLSVQAARLSLQACQSRRSVGVSSKPTHSVSSSGAPVAEQESKSVKVVTHSRTCSTFENVEQPFMPGKLLQQARNSVQAHPLHSLIPNTFESNGVRSLHPSRSLHATLAPSAAAKFESSGTAGDDDSTPRL